jgi:putative ABC transport system ATP-binding protein
MSPDTIVEFEAVSKTYGRHPRVHAVTGVSFAIRSGETVAIMGPSGSGKSTILNLAAGLDTPSSGRVTIDATDLAALDDRKLTTLRRDKIGMVFQAFNLLPTLSAIENVSLPLRLRGTSTAEARTRAAQALSRVDLDERGSHRPDALSGGEQQRVAIARAIVTNPRVLLADEPTGNLDSKASAAVLSTLADLNRELGTTILLVTHDANAAALCRRVLRIADGRLDAEPPAPESR